MDSITFVLATLPARRLETLEPDAVVAADKAASISFFKRDSGHHATSRVMRRQGGTDSRREGMKYDGTTGIHWKYNALASGILKAYQAGVLSPRSTLSSVGPANKRDSMRCAVNVSVPVTNTFLLILVANNFEPILIGKTILIWNIGCHMV